MKYPKYPEYKDSGIEWIGEIPKHWSVLKLKRICTFDYGESLSSEEREGDSFPVFGSNGVIDRNDRVNTSSPVIIVGRKGSFGKLTYSEVPGFAIDTTFFIEGEKTKVALLWLYYALSSLKLDSFSQDTGVPGLSRESAYERRVAIPTVIEQNSISRYLHSQGKKIDSLISKQQQMIELLKEKRQAIITHAVTKGLDSNVPMKDSGVEWIGEIPEHWKIDRIKHTSYVKGRVGWKGLTSDEYLDEGYAYLVTGQDFFSKYINWESCFQVDKVRYDDDPYIQLVEGDLLLTKDGTIGKLAVVKNLQRPACLNSGIFLVRPINSYLSDYLYWVLSSQVFSGFHEFTSIGSTIQHLYQNTFENFYFPIPPISEQTEIVQYLENRTKEIDLLMKKQQKMIALLNEHKASLISEAVTGKIDVGGLVQEVNNSARQTP